MERRWRIYRFWRSPNGWSLVTYQVDTVDTIEEAFDWARQHNIKCNKYQGVLIKKEGSKHRLYTPKDWQYWHGHEWQPREPEPPFTPEPEPEMTQLPLLEAPNPFKSVWRSTPPTKRRL